MEFFKLCKVNDEIRGGVQFEPWPHIIDLLNVIETNRYISIAKSKKQGISTFLGIRALWKVLTCPGWNHLFISSGEREGSRQLLGPAKYAYLNLPKEIRDAVRPDKWSDTQISFPSMGSGIIVLPSSQSGSVGEAASEVDIDEHDFHQYPDEDWSTAEATTSGGGKMISSSTRWLVNPENSVWLKTYLLAKEKKNDFVPVFISCFSRPGFDEKWREDKRKNYIAIDGRMFEWNYPRTEDEVLKAIDAVSFFDTSIINNYISQSREPMEDRWGFAHIYSRFHPLTAYAVGVDVSQGVAEDYQSMVILGKRGQTIEDISYIHANKLSSSTFAFYTNELAKEYNFPLLGGEANAMGLSYLQELEQMKYPKLYYRDEQQTKLGWWTNKTSRDTALIDLAKAISDGTLVIRYKPLLKQMLEFQRMEGRSGQIEYQSIGKHDDLVMGCAIAYQVLKDVRQPGVKVKSLVTAQTMGGMYA